MYTLHCNPADPMLGFPGMIQAITSAIPATSVAGFSTAGVPGFGPPPAGTFAVYRNISRHPTVALVRRMVTAPIVANTWGWMKKPDVPEQWLSFVRDMLQPMRTRVLQHGLQALEFGFSSFEIIWALSDGKLVVDSLKPLLAETTKILVDSHGNYKGLSSVVNQDKPRAIPGNKAFLYTYDADCGDYYGRSRHENVRVSYSQAMQTAERLAQYHKKISGVTVQLHYPEGTSRDAAGVERSNDYIAQQILEAVSMGRSVRFPNLFASVEDPATAADLAGKSQWVLSQFDVGATDYSPGLLNALAYYDKLLFRGWLRPERVGLDTQHGSRADAKQHTDSIIVDSELVDQDFADAFNAQVVDQVLTLNFGPAAKGAVWADPSPISDTKTDTLRGLLTALVGNKETGAEVAGKIDLNAVLDDLDVPTA